MYTYNAELVRVIDGDTVVAMIDLGFSTWVKRTIRFYGIDAYESRTRDKEEKVKGLAAKKLVSDILEEFDGKFLLQSHGVGKFGRCLGTLMVINEADETININKRLINEGLAVKYNGGSR